MHTTINICVLCKEHFLLSLSLSRPMLCDQADDQMGIPKLAVHLL